MLPYVDKSEKAALLSLSISFSPDDKKSLLYPFLFSLEIHQNEVSTLCRRSTDIDFCKSCTRTQQHRIIIEPPNASFALRQQAACRTRQGLGEVMEGRVLLSLEEKRPSFSRLPRPILSFPKRGKGRRRRSCLDVIRGSRRRRRLSSRAFGAAGQSGRSSVLERTLRRGLFTWSRSLNDRFHVAMCFGC